MKYNKKHTEATCRRFAAALAIAALLFVVLPAHAQYMSFFGDSTREYHITYLTKIPDDYINSPPEEPNPLSVYCRTYSWQYNRNHYCGDPSIPYPTYNPHGYLDQTTIGLSFESNWHILYEDTLFGRLYWRDIIICDMSLTEGDTFVLPFISDTCWWIVFDTIQIEKQFSYR